MINTSLFCTVLLQCTQCSNKRFLSSKPQVFVSTINLSAQAISLCLIFGSVLLILIRKVLEVKVKNVLFKRKCRILITSALKCKNFEEVRNSIASFLFDDRRSEYKWTFDPQAISMNEICKYPNTFLFTCLTENFVYNYSRRVDRILDTTF